MPYLYQYVFSIAYLLAAVPINSLKFYKKSIKCEIVVDRCKYRAIIKKVIITNIKGGKE